MRRLRLSLAVFLIALFTATRALAHDVRGTAVLLDIGDRVVHVELQLPISQLELALGHTVWPGQEGELKTYLATHFHARSRAKIDMPVAITSIGIHRVDDGDALVAHADIESAPGESARFLELSYDAILHRVSNHNILVFVRHDVQSGKVDGAPEPLGTLHYQKTTLVIDRSAGSLFQGLRAMFQVGVRHIAEGTDHLLFLLMLLLPAPSLSTRRRWGAPGDWRRAARQTVKVVTAFTLGHSLTLILTAIRGVELPSRPIEVLIAVSILVSAIHALRPIFPGREALVAGGFGLVHGLAFASTLVGIGLDRATLATSVLGFNLGVEAMQLLIVVVTMPWLIVASRSDRYRYLRVAGASVGALAATGWIAERALGLRTPVPSLIEALAARAPWLGVALAAVAIGLALARPNSQSLADCVGNQSTARATMRRTAGSSASSVRTRT
jgi:hypothetical protein